MGRFARLGGRSPVRKLLRKSLFHCNHCDGSLTSDIERKRFANKYVKLVKRVYASGISPVKSLSPRELTEKKGHVFFFSSDFLK